jgi:mannose-6-phosphate isomerase class I
MVLKYIPTHVGEFLFVPLQNPHTRL